MSALLEVKALSAGYGRVPVLHGVDLAVEEGEIVGVLGHNGMGQDHAPQDHHGDRPRDRRGRRLRGPRSHPGAGERTGAARARVRAAGARHLPCLERP